VAVNLLVSGAQTKTRCSEAIRDRPNSRLAGPKPFRAGIGPAVAGHQDRAAEAAILNVGGRSTLGLDGRSQAAPRGVWDQSRPGEQEPAGRQNAAKTPENCTHDEPPWPLIERRVRRRQLYLFFGEPFLANHFLLQRNQILVPFLRAEGPPPILWGKLIARGALISPKRVPGAHDDASALRAWWPHQGGPPAPIRASIRRM